MRGVTFTRSNLPVGSYYGRATGIVGLRLFPNPDFDEAAKAWDPERYYNDQSYYNDPLVRPYRVGMSCGFCHVGPSPIHPPADPEHPQWANLNSNVGTQYLWIDRIFIYAADQTNLPLPADALLPPGTLDTSLVSTDCINNPRTMNAIYRLGPAWIGEALGEGDAERGRAEQQAALRPLRSAEHSWSPRVLKDGSDSVGALGALNRVYINIGLFSEEWLRHFNPFFGGKPITRSRSRWRRQLGVWQATEAQHPDMAEFLVRPGSPTSRGRAGRRGLPDHGRGELDRGKMVFAENCARCHSSKLPDGVRASSRRAAARGPTIWTAGNAIGLRPRPRIQVEDARDRRAPFPQGQLPLDRSAHPRDAPAH